VGSDSSLAPLGEIWDEDELDHVPTAGIMAGAKLDDLDDESDASIHDDDEEAFWSFDEEDHVPDDGNNVSSIGGAKMQ